RPWRSESARERDMKNRHAPRHRSEQRLRVRELPRAQILPNRCPDHPRRATAHVGLRRFQVRGSKLLDTHRVLPGEAVFEIELGRFLPSMTTLSAASPLPPGHFSVCDVAEAETRPEM